MAAKHAKEQKARPSGAKTAAKPQALNSYFNNHLKVLRQTLDDLKRRPVASLLTGSVIGVALVLPTLLLILLANIQSADMRWEGSAQITLFAKLNQSQNEISALANKLAERADVISAIFVDKDAALAEFSERFEIRDVNEFLDENPLPHAIIVTPNTQLNDLQALETLKQQLESLKQIDSSLLDALWIQRLQSITSFLERAVALLAIMLAVAVLLILGNTIRLAIENRKEEIAVLKLVGGTRAFVCRPFLYMGVFYGLVGSIVATILTQLMVSILAQPVNVLAMSYQSQFELSGLGFESTLFLILCGTGLGWLGAWLAVNRHMDEIEPD